MRPLTLRLRGLRSYRSEVEIDFRDHDLAAIIGDTGSGKSSILEGICFALYGTSTWRGNNVRDLIAASEPAVSVEFTFRADDKTWVVTRLSRTSGTAQHRLVCEDDPAQRYDSAADVNRRIQELVGLDYGGFLRAVVLPQGRFHQLLQATPAERNSVLKGIFRVDELELVRVAAENAKARVNDTLSGRELQRARLLENPGLAAAEAAEAMATAGAEVAAAVAAASAYDASNALASNARARATLLRSLEVEIARDRRPADADAFAELERRSAELDRELAATNAKLEAADEAADRLEEQLLLADDAGLGEKGLAHAASVLDRALNDLPALRQERDRLEDEKQRVAAAASELTTRRVEVDELRTRALDADRAVEAATMFATDEDAALTAARDALRDARTAATGETDATRAHDDLVARSAALAGELATAEAGLAAAHESLAAANDSLLAARRMDHAAAAADGVAPGDPCPICARELPDGFVAPHASEAAAATAAQAAAADAERRAETGVTRLRERHETLLADAKRAEASVATAAEALAGVLARLDAVCPNANLELDDAGILAPLTARANAAGERVRELRTVASTARTEATRASATLDAAERDLARQQHELDGAIRRLGERRHAYEDVLVALPVQVRPEKTVDEQALRAARAIVTDLEAVVRAAQAERATIQKEVRALRELAARCTSARQQEVDRPAGELRVKQAALVRSLTAAAGHLGLPYQPPLGGEEFVLADAAAAAATADRWAGDMLAQAARSAERATTEADEADRAMANALAGAGVLSRAELDTRRIAAAAALSTAERDHAEAIRQQPICAMLDERITAARELVDSLEMIRVHFSDAKFLGYVMGQRQQILLAVGSEVLASMTNGRYGFAADFRIVDSWSGQPRDVMTLSGGETFLASLALALGLVELAGRSGGKLDALFLDEGFGSLDANTLPDALRALEGQASGGRFVAVISHLRAVAESFDHVLHVTRTPSGSKAEWLTPEARDRMLGSDAESGLLS